MSECVSRELILALTSELRPADNAISFSEGRSMQTTTRIAAQWLARALKVSVWMVDNTYIECIWHISHNFAAYVSPISQAAECAIPAPVIAAFVADASGPRHWVADERGKHLSDLIERRLALRGGVVSSSGMSGDASKPSTRLEGGQAAADDTETDRDELQPQ